MYNYYKIQNKPMTDNVKLYLNQVNKEIIHLYQNHTPIPIELKQWGKEFIKYVFFSDLYLADWNLKNASRRAIYNHLVSWRKSLSLQIARKLWNFLPTAYLGTDLLNTNEESISSPVSHLVIEIEGKYVDYVRQGNFAFWTSIPKAFAPDVIAWSKERHIYIQIIGDKNINAPDVAYTYVHKALFDNANKEQLGWDDFLKHFINEPVSETLPFYKFVTKDKSRNKLEKFELESLPLKGDNITKFPKIHNIHKPV
jgi:hypothetical protein